MKRPVESWKKCRVQVRFTPLESRLASLTHRPIARISYAILGAPPFECAALAALTCRHTELDRTRPVYRTRHRRLIHGRGENFKFPEDLRNGLQYVEAV